MSGRGIAGKIEANVLPPRPMFRGQKEGASYARLIPVHLSGRKKEGKKTGFFAERITIITSRWSDQDRIP